MLELFRRATSNGLTVAEMAEQIPVGPVAVIDKPESEAPFPEVDPLADGAHQFESSTVSLAIGAEVQITATRPPERWTVYMPLADLPNAIAVNHGARRTGSGVVIGGRAVLVLPGRGESTITLWGSGLTATCTVQVIASSGLPVAVSPA